MKHRGANTPVCRVDMSVDAANRSVCATLLLLLALLTGSCGYHVAGHADLMPKTIKTIAIPAFGNQTVHQKLSQLISEDLTREFISRTSYRIVAEPEKARSEEHTSDSSHV